MIAALLLIAAITGNVIGPDGAPVPKARVVAYRAETELDKLRREAAKKERPILGAATTDDKGAFKLDAPDGIVQVHVEAAGFNAEPVLVPADEHDVTIAIAKGKKVEETRSPEEGITIRGIVVDSSDKPVAHATVVAEGLAVATSGDDGRFTLEHVPRGSPLQAFGESAMGFAVARSAESTIRVRRVQKVSGVVRDEAKRPVAGVVIQWIRGDMVIGGSTGDAVSDAKGAYSILVPEADQSQFIANAGPYVEATMARDGGTTRDVTIKRLAIIDGVVRDDSDKPVAGATVMFDTDDARGLEPMWVVSTRQAVTNATGRFRLHVPAGWKGRIHAVPHAAMPSGSSEPMTVPAAGRHDVIVKLRPGIEVNGVVTDSRGQPLGGVAIRRPGDVASRFFNSIEDAWATTADDGSFSVRLEPGAGALVFAKQRFVETTSEFKVMTAVPPLRITLKEAAIVRGILVGKDEQPAAGEPLVEAQSTVMAWTNADGTFELDFPAPGTYTVEATTFGRKFPVHAPSNDVRLVLDPGLSIRGRVTDAATGKPIEDFVAEVTRGDEDLQASVDQTGPGEFVISQLDSGPLVVTVGAEHYVPAHANAEAGQADPVALTLHHGLTLRGLVHDAAGQPIEGVSVQFDHREPETRPYRITLADGTFDLDGVEPDEKMTLSFSKYGWLYHTEQVHVTSGMTPVDVVLDRGLTVRGHVLDRSGKPVADMSVQASSAAFAGQLASAHTDGSGAFTLEAMAPVRYDFRATSPRSLIVGELRDVDVEQVHDITIRVEQMPSGTIAGRVTGMKPTTLMSAVNVETPEGTSLHGEIRPDRTFRIGDVPVGLATVYATLNEAGSARMTRKVPVDVAADAVSNVELQFGERRTLRGRVTRNGHSLAQADVVLDDADTRATTADDGTYELRADPGRYRITIEGTPYSGEVDVEQTSVFDIDVQSVTSHVRVIDGDSGAPISAATVRAGNVRSITAADGRADVEILRGETVALIASKDGYANAAADAIGGEVVMQLTRSTGAVVRIVDARDGRTLTGHAVARDAAGRVIASADEAEADGTSRLALAPGEYRFSASAEGYGSETVRASVPSNEVRIALPRGGRLLLRSNEDVHGTARLLLPDGDVYVRCWCNGVGDIQINGRLTTVDVVSPGSYTLEVTPLGGKPRRYPVTVVQNETVTVQID